MREYTIAMKHIIPGLQCSDYEYEGEKELQKTLNANEIIKKLFSVVSEYGVERLVLLEHIGSDIEVKKTNLPELHAILHEVCNIIDVKPLPKMYVTQNPAIHAGALGINNPIIEVSTGTLDKLSVEELYFIIGHEAGHIKSKHTRYGFLHTILPFLGSMVPAIGSLVSFSIEVLLYKYDRMAEFTADRAGLLCCQDLNAATESLMKLAGYPEQYYDKINKDDFIQQFDEFKEYNENTFNKALNVLANMNRTHPWSVLRGKELYEWVDNNGYEAILRKAKKSSHKDIKRCIHCGNTIISGKFCPYCGNKYK